MRRRNNADESFAVGGEYAPAFADIMSGFAHYAMFLCVLRLGLGHRADPR